MERRPSAFATDDSAGWEIAVVVFALPKTALFLTGGKDPLYYKGLLGQPSYLGLGLGDPRLDLRGMPGL